MTTPATRSDDSKDGRSDLMTQREAFDYGWKWFEYHAAQRMKAFDFFLIAISAIFVGYSTAVRSGSQIQAAAIATFGFVVVVAFFVLDCRNEDLVNIGRKALQNIEDKEKVLSEDCWKLSRLGSERACWKSHNLWLRLIQACALIVFLTAACESWPLACRDFCASMRGCGINANVNTSAATSIDTRTPSSSQPTNTSKHKIPVPGD
jgi:hypothetical protein